jgi:predicted metal-dependent enzyme (double-stranded beta helix superfamily)
MLTCRREERTVSQLSVAKQTPAVLQDFLQELASIQGEFVQPADIVLESAPLMLELLPKVSDFLTEKHRQGTPDHYARNQVYCEPDGSMSLFCMVWRPGQWTPVHDHGAWGLVAVVDGALQERNYIRTDPQERPDSGIILRRGGVSVLAKGSVTTFVPNPDHIHRAGVPRGWQETVTLHLYGRNMTRYNVYDMELGRRTPVDVDTDNRID